LQEIEEIVHLDAEDHRELPAGDRAGNRIRARSRLRSASHRLGNFAHRVVSLAGRKNILPPLVAADMLAREAEILEDVGTLEAQYR
jgi:hypothetical protein